MKSTDSIEHQDCPFSPEGILRPEELKFITFLREMKFGTIERLIIRDGLPKIAELVTKTVKFD